MRDTQALAEKIRHACAKGGLIAVTGPVGCGKSSLLYRLKSLLQSDSQYVVCQSLLVEKNKVSFKNLIDAILFDLAPDWRVLKIQRDIGKREQQLSKAIQDVKKPVVFLIDDAQDLPFETLNGLQRLLDLASPSLFTTVLFLDSDYCKSTFDKVAESLQGPCLSISLGSPTLGLSDDDSFALAESGTQQLSSASQGGVTAWLSH